MNIKKELGEKIKRLRKAKGLTQEQLAERIDISTRNLCNIETGVSYPKSDTLEKILNSLNTTTEEIFENNHLCSQSELIEQINCYIELISQDNNKLELAHKLLKAVVSK